VGSPFRRRARPAIRPNGAPVSATGNNAAPRVSVVTPFYNTGQYLAECIDSVLKQTYRDFEYILVDNQSTDAGGAIADEYARRDSRIRVVRTPSFLTQVQNYNFALSQIADGSRYVKMVQADDWLFPPCLEQMVALAEPHPSIAVVSAYELRGVNVCGSGLPFETKVITGREACRIHMLQGISLFGTPTTVLMAADVVRGRSPSFYEEGRYFEDGEVMYEILANRDFGFVHQVLSFNRVRPDSLWGTFKKVDPRPLADLTHVTRFGRQYLTEDEYRVHLAHCRDVYFKMVARSWARGAGEDFMAFHRKGLADIGETLDRATLVKYAAAAVADDLIPKRLLGRLGKIASEKVPFLRRDGDGPSA
jgi:glycosyltransferase involved in cell wall biosynthesis